MDLRAAGATTSDIQRFLNASLHLRALPFEDVHCRLFARLVTQESEVEGSNADDLDHMALVLPAASIVVTDRVLTNAIRALGLDQKYGFQSFLLPEADELLAAIEAV